MTQRIIKGQFIKYLDGIYLTYCSMLDEQFENERNKISYKLLPNKYQTRRVEVYQKLKNDQKAYLDLIKNVLSVGNCYSFALCHAVFDIMGKLKWWEALLVRFATWNAENHLVELQAALAIKDKKFKSIALATLEINRVLCLPDSEISSQQATLQHHLERGINYIISNQFHDNLKSFYSKDLSLQQDVFKSFGSYGVLLQGTLCFIKNTYVMAGIFSQSDLEKILTEDCLKNSICIISDCGHSIRIACHDSSTWMIYEANFDHRDPELIHRVGTKLEIISNIFAILHTNSLSIELATFDSNKKFSCLHYEKLINCKPMSMLNATTLILFSRDAPMFLLLLMRSTHPSLRSILASLLPKQAKARSGLAILCDYSKNSHEFGYELFKLADLSPDGLKLRSAIAKALPIIGRRQWCALHSLFLSSQKTIEMFFNLIDETAEGKQLLVALAAALAIYNDESHSALYEMICSAPKLIPRLFQLIDNSPEGKALSLAVAKSFSCVVAKYHHNGLHAMSCQPEYLSQLCELINENPERQAIRIALAVNLIGRNIFQINGLRAVIRDAPKILPGVIETVLKTNNAREAADIFSLLIIAFGDEYRNGVTAWQAVSRLAKSAKLPIIQLLKSHLEKIDTQDLVAIGNQIRRARYKDTSEYRGICKQRYYFFKGCYGKTTLWQGLMLKIQQILQQRHDLQQTPEITKLLSARTW